MFHVKHFYRKTPRQSASICPAPPKLHQKHFQFYPPLIRHSAKILPGTILSHKVSHVIFVPVKAPATREEELQKRAAHGERLACYAGFRMRSHMCPDVSRGTSGHIHSFIEKSSGRSYLFPKMFHVNHFPVKRRKKFLHYQRRVKSYLGIPSSKNSSRKNVSRGTIYYPSLSVMKAASANCAREALLSPIFSTAPDKTPCSTLTPHPKSSFSSVFRRVFA